MAPKRGGGGGGGGGGGISINNRCSTSGAFRTTYEQAYLAIDALGLIFLFIILFVWLAKRKATPSMKHPCRGFTYGLALLLQILYTILDIINFCLQQCAVINYYDEAMKITAVVVWFAILSTLLLFACLVFNVLPAMWKSVGSKPLIPIIVTGAGLALSTLVAIIFLGFLSYNYSNYYDIVFDDTRSHFMSQNRSAAAMSFLLLALSVVICVFMVIPILKMKSAGLQSGSLKLTMPIFAVFFVGWRLSAFVQDAYYGLEQHSSTTNESIVRMVFDLLLTIGTFLVLIFVASAIPAPSQVPNQPPQKVEGTAYPTQTQYASYQQPPPMYPAPAQNGYGAPVQNGVTPPAQTTYSPPAQNAYNPPQMAPPAPYQPNMQYNPVQVQPQNQWGGVSPVPTQPVNH